jgi:hypothetical protein
MESTEKLVAVIDYFNAKLVKTQQEFLLLQNIYWASLQMEGRRDRIQAHMPLMVDHGIEERLN